jgi:hypothetical protein
MRLPSNRKICTSATPASRGFILTWA